MYLYYLACLHSVFRFFFILALYPGLKFKQSRLILEINRRRLHLATDNQFKKTDTKQNQKFLRPVSAM